MRSLFQFQTDSASTGITCEMYEGRAACVQVKAGLIQRLDIVRLWQKAHLSHSRLWLAKQQSRWSVVTLQGSRLHLACANRNLLPSLLGFSSSPITTAWTASNSRWSAEELAEKTPPLWVVVRVRRGIACRLQSLLHKVENWVEC